MPWIAGQLEGPLQAEKWLPVVEEGPAVTISFRRFEGAAWVDYTAVPKVWVGNSWAVRRPKRWDGTAWVDLP